MANIIELREMSGDKLSELLENAREEMFNLRFQKAGTRLENYARLKQVRREIAQLETELHARQLAKDAGVAHPAVAAALNNKTWKATARFSYEDTAWRVEYMDEAGSQLAMAMVDLNRPTRLVKSYQV